MAPPKTKEQLEAENEDLRKRLEAQQQQAPAAASSFDFGFLNFFKDNWFMLLITGGLFWYFTQHEQGKEHWGQLKELFSGLLESLLGLLPESWQNGIKAAFGMDMSGAIAGESIENIRKNLRKQQKLTEEMIEIIAPSHQAFMSLVDEVKAANGGKVKFEDFTNDKTLFALLKNPARAPMLQQLVVAATKGNAAETDAGKKIKTSLLKIVEGEGLDVLLSQHRDNTLALIRLVPGVTDDEMSVLKTLIKGNMSAEGKASPQLREVFKTLLTGDDKNNLLAQEQRLGNAVVKAAQASNSPKDAVDELLKSKAVLEHPLAGPLVTLNGGKAIAALRAAMNDDKKMLAATGVFQTQDKNQIATFILENHAAFKAYRQAAGDEFKKLPEAIQKPLSTLLDQPEAAVAPLKKMAASVDLSKLDGVFNDPKTRNVRPMPELVNILVKDSNARAVVAKVDPTDLAEYAKVNFGAMPYLTARNITALVKAAEEIGSKLPQEIKPEEYDKLLPEARGKYRDELGKREPTLAMISALTEAMLKGDPTALKKFSPAQFAAVWSDKNTQEAMHQLLRNLELPHEKAAIRDILLQPRNWQAVTEVSADSEAGAKFMLEQLAKLGTKKDAASCAKGMEWSEALGALWNGGIIFKNALGKNLDRMQEIGKSIQAVECGTAPVAAAPSTPARPVSRGNSYRPPASSVH